MAHINKGDIPGAAGCEKWKNPGKFAHNISAILAL
jgi:hypothetical protein